MRQPRWGVRSCRCPAAVCGPVVWSGQPMPSWSTARYVSLLPCLPGSTMPLAESYGLPASPRKKSKWSRGSADLSLVAVPLLAVMPVVMDWRPFLRRGRSNPRRASRVCCRQTDRRLTPQRPCLPSSCGHAPSRSGDCRPTAGVFVPSSRPLPARRLPTPRWWPSPSTTGNCFVSRSARRVAPPKAVSATIRSGMASAFRSMSI